MPSGERWNNTLILYYVMVQIFQKLSLVIRLCIQFFCYSLLVISRSSVSLFPSALQYMLHFCPKWQYWVYITYNDRNPWNPQCETDHKCLCIFGGYQLLIYAVFSQHAGRSILNPGSTSMKSNSDKEIIKDGKRWIWFWGSVSNWAHERYWQGAEAAAALPY